MWKIYKNRFNLDLDIVNMFVLPLKKEFLRSSEKYEDTLFFTIGKVSSESQENIDKSMEEKLVYQHQEAYYVLINFDLVVQMLMMGCDVAKNKKALSDYIFSPDGNPNNKKHINLNIPVLKIEQLYDKWREKELTPLLQQMC